MDYLRSGLEKRYLVFSATIVVALLCVVISLLSLMHPLWAAPFEFVGVVATALALLGVYDIMQTHHAILRNYPVIGHMRFLMETIRPELRQYFFEADTDGRPFPRERRAIVYQRAKNQLDKRPFGTHNDVYSAGAEWMLHSIMPAPVLSRSWRT